MMHQVKFSNLYFKFIGNGKLILQFPNKLDIIQPIKISTAYVTLYY